MSIACHSFYGNTQRWEFLNAYQDLGENEWQGRRLLDGPKAAEDYFRSQMAYYREREIVLCAFMNSGGWVISCEKISDGKPHQLIPSQNSEKSNPVGYVQHHSRP